MSHTMITKHHNHDFGYIALILDGLEGVPETIQTESRTFLCKSEFHVSLMAIVDMLPIIQATDARITETQLVADFLDFQKTTDLSTVKINADFRLMKKSLQGLARESVVMMVEVPGLESLFDYLRDKYSPAIPTQPTHITLFTLERDKGIGIFSEEELSKYGEKINLPSLSITQ